MTVSRFRTVLYVAVAMVSVAGLADATYLTVQALTGETLSCGGSPDCFRVLGSSYAKVGGIPVALLGALAYFSVFTFATFAAFGYARVAEIPCSNGGCNVPGDAMAAVRAGVSAACVLPVLPVLSSNHLSHCRAADRRPAHTTPSGLVGCCIAEEI